MSSHPESHLTAPARQPVPAPQRNAAGRASLVLGLILVGLSLVQQFSTFVLPFTTAGDLEALQSRLLFNLLASLVMLLLSLATVIVAIIGLVGPPRPRGAAGVGLGIGGSMLVSVGVGMAFAAASGAWLA